MDFGSGPMVVCISRLGAQPTAGVGE
jgi:hypothetical protein